jgi:hypothetical protein
MSRSCCFTCKAHAVLDCCSKCQAVQYCSKSCQKEDWKQHKQICQFLNVGDGAMQVQTDQHTEQYKEVEKGIQGEERNHDEDGKQFFKLFTESTREGSRDAAREMEKIAARQTKRKQKGMLFHSLQILMHTDSKKLRWPNSPLRIMLRFVDANVRFGAKMVTGPTPLHHLSYMANPNDHSFHKNQVILGQQLFRHGANANLADSFPAGRTPLHNACHSNFVTNLDFIQLLLEKGANPNAHISPGTTPIVAVLPMAPGAAKFLLEWSTLPDTTDIRIHIIDPDGVTFLDLVHYCVEDFFDQDDDNPEQRVKHAFLLQQWREIETMLVERGSD